jgi:hypothetical protein
MRQLPEGGMVMRIASGEVFDEEVKEKVTASGKGRLNVVRLAVLVRCMVVDVYLGCWTLR